MPKGLRNAIGAGGAPVTTPTGRDKNGLDDPAAYDRIRQRMLNNYNVTLQNLETVPIKTLEETMDTLAAVIDDYPMLKDSDIIVRGDRTLLSSEAFAGAAPDYLRGSNTVKNYILLNLNEYELNTGDLAAKYSQKVDAHHFPAGTTYKHLIAHEAGHLIEARIIEKQYNSNTVRETVWNDGAVANQILTQSYLYYVPKAQRKAYQVMRADVSGYSANSDHGLSASDTFAECISDYAANKAKAKPLSIAVRKMLKEEYNR